MGIGYGAGARQGVLRRRRPRQESQFLYRLGSLLSAAVAAALAAGPSAARELAPTPPELKLVFESYTRHVGLDPKACSFGVWNRDIAGLSPSQSMDNAFARCTLPAGYRVCTRIAGELPDQAQVKDGCIAGFDRLSFLALAAVSTQGGFFIVVHDSKDRPIRLSQQLALGFGPQRDFCELSARLIDREAKLVAGTIYHHFPHLLVDKTICLRPR